MRTKVAFLCFFLTINTAFPQEKENPFMAAEASSEATAQANGQEENGPPDDGDPEPVPIDNYLPLLFVLGAGIITGLKTPKGKELFKI